MNLKKLIGYGVRAGKKTLTVAAKILIALIEEVEDMQYMRTHCLCGSWKRCSVGTL